MSKIKIILFILSGLFLSLFLTMFLISPLSLDNFCAANNTSEKNHEGYGGSFSNSGNNSLFNPVMPIILTRQIWFITDIILAVLYLYLLFIVYEDELVFI